MRSNSRKYARLAIFAATATLAACSGAQPDSSGNQDPGGNPNGTSTPTGDVIVQELSASIGSEGGELIGAKGTAFEGVHVVIPTGALADKTLIRVVPSSDATPLPTTAHRCGAMFDLLPAGLALAVPATVTLPFDENEVTTNERFDDQVKVWVRTGDKWGQRKQTDSAEGSVTVTLGTLTTVAAGVNPPKEQDVVRFHLYPNPKFARCLAQYPDDPKRQPRADVIVVRGDQNDAMLLHGSYLKPGLQFDMFTVEHSALLTNGTPDPAFSNFGLAWYQSDLEAHDDGYANVVVRTILLDQIFGFDPAVTLPPTSTLHVGFWFNDPNDAVPCGFDAAKPTPFNGEHQAGPLAMISVPDATTDLGPLCTKPDTSTTPAHCSP